MSHNVGKKGLEGYANNDVIRLKRRVGAKERESAKGSSQIDVPR